MLRSKKAVVKKVYIRKPFDFILFLFRFGACHNVKVSFKFITEREWCSRFVGAAVRTEQEKFELFYSQSDM